jgi:hypothetical protein
MSEENVQIVRRVFDTLESPDAAVRAIWHPDVEFDVSRDIWGPLVGGGRYRGVEGVRSLMVDLYSGWEGPQLRGADRRRGAGHRGSERPWTWEGERDRA